MSSLPWLIWTLSSFFVVLNYVQQVLPTVITEELSSALNVSEASLGGLSASYFYAYAILQIPAGLLLDRFGVRRPLTLAILVASVGTYLFSDAHSAAQGFFARVLMGAGFAFSFLGCLKLVHIWFPVSRFSTMAGMTNTVAMLGAACSAPLALMVGVIGWRQTLLGAALLTVILGFLVFLVVRDRPMTSREGSIQAQPSGLREIISLAGDTQVWINAIYATSISLIFVAFGGLWGVDFIRKRYVLDEVSAASVSSLLFVGGILGSLFFGWYSDYLESRKKPMMFASLAGLASLCELLYAPELSLTGFRCCLFLTGFFCSANILSYALARDLSPRASGFSIGLLSTCFYAGSASSQPVVGYLLERHARWAAVQLNSITDADYVFALSFLVVLMVLGVLLSFLVKDIHPKAARL